MQNYEELSLRLEAIIETAIDCIITIDNKGIIESVNNATEKLFGYTKDELIGNNVSMLMPQPDRAHHDKYVSNYVKTRVPKIIGIGRETKGMKKDGSVFPLRLAISEIILNDRIIFTGIIHDLSDVNAAKRKILDLNKTLEEKILQRTNDLEKVVLKLKDKEYKLKLALEKEKELNELKSRFVSMTSHEFRTPLTSVLSSASLIGKYTLEGQQPNRERHINKIKNAVTHLTSILNDFLSLSKLEEQKITTTYEKCILDDVVDDVIEDMHGILKSQKIIFSTNKTRFELSSDVTILKNILFNLLSNAVKYSDDDIHCDVQHNEEHFTITIKDSGLGIPVEDQKRLFNRFYRASNVSNIQGTGLGLNIVQHYILLLKGSITFQSTEHVGTTFKISLPYHYEDDINH